MKLRRQPRRPDVLPSMPTLRIGGRYGRTGRAGAENRSTAETRGRAWAARMGSKPVDRCEPRVRRLARARTTIRRLGEAASTRREASAESASPYLPKASAWRSRLPNTRYPPSLAPEVRASRGQLEVADPRRTVPRRIHGSTLTRRAEERRSRRRPGRGGDKPVVRRRQDSAKARRTERWRAQKSRAEPQGRSASSHTHRIGKWRSSRGTLAHGARDVVEERARMSVEPSSGRGYVTLPVSAISRLLEGWRRDDSSPRRVFDKPPWYCRSTAAGMAQSTVGRRLS